MLKQAIVGAVCALVLAACSSSGGGSSVSSHSVNGTGGNTASKPKPTPSAAMGKQYMVLGSGAHSVSFPDAAKIHKITVNGKTFDLTNANFGGSSGNYGWRTYGNGLYGGNPPPAGLSAASVWVGSKNATAGVVTMADSGQRFAFFNGKFTDVKSLPSGKVTYAADVVTTRTGGIVFGKRDVEANFATKKLTAQVNDNVTLNADIKGNRFESAANAPTKVQGGFFGNQAAEVAGVFQNGDVIGVFGGKKK